MQFLENSVVGLRSAAYELAHDERDETFLLMPMVHIGTPEYYSQVMMRLTQCTHIAFEGVRTPSAWLLTKAYSLIAHRRALGLITQNDGLDMSAFGAVLIHSDMTTKEFSKSWRQIPLAYRLGISLVAPMYGAYQFCFASRESIARKQSVEDYPSRYTVIHSDVPFRKAIGKDRDCKLIKTLDKLLSEESGCRRIGVVWGARHIPAVANYLINTRGFRAKRAEWLSVL